MVYFNESGNNHATTRNEHEFHESCVAVSCPVLIINQFPHSWNLNCNQPFNLKRPRGPPSCVG